MLPLLLRRFIYTLHAFYIANTITVLPLQRRDIVAFLATLLGILRGTLGLVRFLFILLASCAAFSPEVSGYGQPFVHKISSYAASYTFQPVGIVMPARCTHCHTWPASVA